MDDSLLDVAGRLGRLVKAQRTAMGLSLGELGREAGLSKTIVAKIESGEGNPSVETLWRLSRALALPMGTLLSGRDELRTHVIPARSGRSPASESGMQAWLVHAEGRERRTEVFELAFDAGVDHVGTPHLPGTEELVFCISGRLAVGPAGGEVELGAGDAVRFAADVPHVYRGLRAARAIDLILYPSAPR